MLVQPSKNIWPFVWWSHMISITNLISDLGWCLNDFLFNVVWDFWMFSEASYHIFTISTGLCGGLLWGTMWFNLKTHYVLSRFSSCSPWVFPLFVLSQEMQSGTRPSHHSYLQHSSKLKSSPHYNYSLASVSRDVLTWKLFCSFWNDILPVLRPSELRGRWKVPAKNGTLSERTSDHRRPVISPWSWPLCAGETSYS